MTVYLASNIGTGISPWAPVIDSVDVNDRGVMTVVWHESPTAPHHNYLIEDGLGNHQTALTVGQPAVIDISTWSLSGSGLSNNVILRPVTYYTGDGTNDPNTQNSGFVVGSSVPPPWVGVLQITFTASDMTPIVGENVTFSITKTTPPPSGGGGGV